MKTFVLYHANCRDGFGAKFAAWKKFGEQAEYLPVQYGKPPPQLNGLVLFKDARIGEVFKSLVHDGDKFSKVSVTQARRESDRGVFKGDIVEFSPNSPVNSEFEVYICDFSYPRDVLDELRSRASKLVILDHHKTAKEALEGFPGAIFDMNKSGAVLAWEYFHPNEPVPLLLQHVQDRDLWRFNLQGTNEVHSSLMLLGDDLNSWEAMAEDSEMGRYFMAEAVKTGSTILKYETKKVEGAVKSVKVLPYRGYKVGVLNTTTLVSEIGSEIYNTLDVDFSMSYFIDPEGLAVLSFRSKGDFDVSALARELGGGGHKNAAGAPGQPLSFIADLYAGKL